MYLHSDDRRPPMTSQFALRVAIMGGVALAMFAVIFFRLWYLEVLSGDKYRQEALNNQLRQIKVQAPRGEILDRNGKVLVDNRTSLALQVQPDRLPEGRSARRKVVTGLADAAGMAPERIEREIRRQTKEFPASPVTLKRDVPYALVYFLQEHQDEYPGVTVERVYVRRYPQGTLGAHLFGYVREVTEDQLSEPRYQQLDPGDQVGQTGVEFSYDHVLRGEDGATRVQVDALGRPRGGTAQVVPPEPGDSLRLTIDADVQAAGEAALASFGLPGAFVAMDVDTGEVVGLGSNPTFDPSVYTRPRIPQSAIDQLYSEATESPQSNRAIQGLYPTGSTFKLITATAALEEGLITPDTPIVDTGSINVGGLKFQNAGGASYGTLSLRRALQVSSDVFFYKQGMEAFYRGGDLIQKWAGLLGLGSLTGIDLPSELAGLLPTPDWRNKLYEQSIDPDSPGGKEIVVEEGETDRPWSIGDNINLAVGQGDLQANPLQMAVAYATVANGGDVVRPHIAQRVEEPTGRVIQEVAPAPRRHADIDPGYRQAILDGLHLAATEAGGTSADIFGDFPVEVAGKTGTAERGAGRTDQSWYVALAPYQDPEVVVAVTIERGGFGAESAAPAARQILASYFDLGARKLERSEAAAAAAEVTGAYD